ncbi:MAG: aldo/keto reductase [Acidimicrobiia bacterium]|nr:aldo/keto reductase [Acidimicrobiia bacterium]MDH4306660.1 aldo/keto reductase [Acidimicrobiia bacterium]MDH5293516.1 aldo/keto reductase [Acidimicrobiia bacterium]
MTSISIGRRRELGPLGEVGAIAFGCWRFVHEDLDTAIEVVSTAVGLGFDLIDTADVYGLEWGGAGFGSVERLLGQVLTARPDLRERVVLATKGGVRPGVPLDSSAAYLQQACDASLGRLGVERIDLYQVHRPDLLTHPEEVAGVLDRLVESGKVRAVGVSNHTVAQTEALASFMRNPLVSTQPRFSAAHLGSLRDGTFDLAMRSGLVPLLWSPLAGGRLVTGEGVRTELTVALDRLAAAHDVDRTTVALAFCLAQAPRPVVIVGSQNVSRLRRYPDALALELSRDEIYTIVEASEGTRPL